VDEVSPATSKTKQKSKPKKEQVPEATKPSDKEDDVASVASKSIDDAFEELMADEQD
jgi:hypothetical protein